jgi:hypothetical protein
MKLLREAQGVMQATWDALEDLAASITSAIGGALDELKAIWRDPKRALDLLKMVYEAGKSKSREIGESIADTLLTYARLPARKLGEMVGRLVGQLAFEAALTYVTVGVGAGITALKTAGREAVRWIVELGKKFFEIVRRVIPYLEDIANLVVRPAKYLTKLFKTVCENLNQAIQRIIDFFYSTLGFCTKGSFKCKAPPGNRPRKNPSARVALFPGEVGIRLTTRTAPVSRTVSKTFASS